VDFGESEVLRNEGSCRLLKVGARRERVVYWVLGGGKESLCFKDSDDAYEDATDEFNLRWMQEKLSNEGGRTE